MKTLTILSAALCIVAPSALRAADTPTGHTDVIFDHPENFTDVKDAFVPTDKGRDYILSQIRDFLVSRTERMLPAGDTLKITFTDIDLAGDFEPQRGSLWEDVRIVKAIYPPHFKFSYVVTDGSGHVVTQGTEDILDLNFQMRVVLDTSDSLRYEKDILGDWARTTLSGLKR